jgi:NDP-sugar pyrophosphorylase family protein
MMRRMKAILVAEKQTTVRGIPLTLPLPLIDILGSSLLQRAIDNLHDAGVEDITVVADFEQSDAFLMNGAPVRNATMVSTKEDVFACVEEIFREAARGDAEAVFLARVSSYFEVDVDRLLSHHFHFHNRVTRLWGGSDPMPMDAFMVSTSRMEDGVQLVRNHLRESSNEGVRYRLNEGDGEYVNFLRDANDLRRLAADGLHLRCGLKPVGKEIRPGIWADESSHIANDARLVAPVFIGKRTRIRAGAVITRGSAIEHHCSVDCGTVVENATLLPYSQVGPCLDLSHSVAGERRIVHLKKNISTEIYDGRMLNSLSASPARRLLTFAGSLFSFMPEHF